MIISWPYILKSLRLRDPELIKRWRTLARYAVEVPGNPAHVLYRNVLDTSRVVVAQRQKWAPSLIWFHVMSDEDVRAMDGLEEGSEVTPFFADFKVSTRYPFVLCETQAVTMTKKDGQPALPEGVKPKRFTLRMAFRRARMMSTTPFFTPTIEELDALIAYLESAEMHDTTEEID